MKIAVVDIETTNWLNKNGLIVEIGIVELDLNTGKKRSLYNELVKEKEFSHSHKDAWIFKNSNLKFEDVMKALPLDVWTIQQIFDKYPATAFNKRFDFDFLHSRGLKISELPCPMKLMTNICKIPHPYYPTYKWPSVQEAWEFLFPKSDYIELHRGFDDAFHEADIIFWLHQRNMFLDSVCN